MVVGAEVVVVGTVVVVVVLGVVVVVVVVVVTTAAAVKLSIRKARALRQPGPSPLWPSPTLTTSIVSLWPSSISTTLHVEPAGIP